MEPIGQRPARERMQTTAGTLAAAGVGALYLGYIDVLGSAGVLLHIIMLVGAGVRLLAVPSAPAGDTAHRAGALLLILAVVGVLGLVIGAGALRPQGLTCALVATALVALAAGTERWT